LRKKTLNEPRISDRNADYFQQFRRNPVTKIEKEDGSIVVLKGFTKTDFDKALGFEEKKEEPATTPETKPDENAAAVPAAQPAAPLGCGSRTGACSFACGC
jgi:hypothetical protein